TSSPVVISDPTSCLSSLIDALISHLYTLSLHDALPIYHILHHLHLPRHPHHILHHLHLPRHLHHILHHLHLLYHFHHIQYYPHRSEEHTSELQSRENLVCRLLLEKKKLRTMSSGPPAQW